MSEYLIQPSPSKHSAYKVETPVPIYDENLWTPTLSFSGGTTGISYTRQIGHYTIIGNMVDLFFDLELSAKGTSVGTVFIHGIPYAIDWISVASGLLFEQHIAWQNLNTAVIAVGASLGTSGGKYVLALDKLTAATTSWGTTLVDTDVTNTTIFIGHIRHLTRGNKN